MISIERLLADFFDRIRPLGVAFVGPASVATSFGRPASSCSSIWESGEGFIQYHIEARDISVYVSSFGWGKYLVAQFAFQEEDPPPPREWLAFVRLAAAVAHAIDHPDEARDSGDAGAPVRRPDPRPLRNRAAEASLR